MATQRSMARRDFDATVKRLGIQERGIEMARRVLVAGERQTAVAAEMKVTVGAVSHQVNRVWREYVNAQEIPAGYERVSAILPADKAAIVRTWESETRRTR